MKVAVLGFDRQGRAAYDYWKAAGAHITVCDQNTELDIPPDANTCLGPDYLQDLDRFDILVRTPGLHPRKIAEANLDAADILNKVTTVTDEFLRVCPTKHVIGVTGTKGKGTTSTLIARMLEAAGKRVHLGGNIGIAPLELLKDDIGQDDWVVLELANFQLIDVKHSPHIAVCLMVIPEHLDWHADMAEYMQAKQQLFRWQTEDDVAVFYQDSENSQEIVSISPGEKIPYFAAPGAFVRDDSIEIASVKLCGVSELKLPGEHNWQNVCAAVTAVWQVTQDVAAIRSVLTTFSGLPFRIELRTEKDGVRYYNDSFSTNSGSTIAALRSITGMKVMILGGHDRGLDLDELCDELVRHQQDIRKVVVIGASGGRLIENLEQHGFHNYVRCEATDMPGVVAAARAEAQDGDAVVLSPSFPSFDMFKNFEVRGEQFNAAVEAL